MKLKKLISVLLAVILTLYATSFNTAVFASSLPSGVTASEAENAAKGTEKLLNNILKMNSIDLKDLIEPMIYSDATVSELLISLYSSISANADDLKAIGIDVSKENVVRCLEAYPDVQKALEKSDSFETADLSEVKWGVNNKKTFAKAVSATLSPFNDVLYMLLCSGEITIADIITVKGKNGYQNAIIPLLNALDCKVTLTQEQFTKKADKDKNSMLYNILINVLSVVDKLEKKPVDTLVTVLPKLAYFSESGQMNECFNSLLSPITEHSLIKLAVLLKIINLDSLNFDVEVLLNDALNELSKESGLTLPPIDFKELSTCGASDGATFNSNKGQAYCVIMAYLIDALKQNKDALPELIKNSGNGEMNIDTEMFSSILSSSSDDLLLLVISLFNENEIGKAENYKYPEVVFSTVTYTPNLTEKNYKRVLNGIDDLIDEFVAEYSDYKKLGTMLSVTLYKNSTASDFILGIYKMLEEQGFLELLSVLGIDASPKGVAKTLTESSYSDVRAALNRASSWEKVNLNGVSWGFYNGSRRGFENAFTASLRPLYPLLNVMLKGETLVVLDSIKISGGNGYNDSIIPVLEALGVEKHNIKTNEQYLKDNSRDAVLKNITSPVFDLLDELMNKPVDTALEILPNALYFIDSGNLEVCINNLLLPITSLIEKTGSEASLIDTSELTKSLDFQQILKSLEKELGIKLKDADIKKLYSFGELKTKESKRVVDGKKTTYSYIEADKEAILITVLRYLVDTLKLPENKGLLTDSLGGGSGDDTFSVYASQIFGQFEGMTTDEIIEWLYNLLFKERVIVPFEEDEKYIPTIIYQETPKDYTPLYVAGGVVLFGIIVGAVFYLNRKKLYY